MSTRPGFIPNDHAELIARHATKSSPLVDMTRRGHAEQTITDAEWERLREHRQRRFDEWQKLTDRLIADGTLIDSDDDPSTLVLNQRPPMRWVHDETTEEWHARIGFKPNQRTVTMPTAR